VHLKFTKKKKYHRANNESFSECTNISYDNNCFRIKKQNNIRTKQARDERIEKDVFVY